MTRPYKQKIAGIITVTFLLCAELVLHSLQKGRQEKILDAALTTETKVTFLAFGDVNLGRKVGKRILSSDIDFPFRRFSIREDSADIVFANLESQISDQNGETGHPKFNLIFTAPPQAVTTLLHSGITLLSTANNHAVDYGIDALKETIDRLEQANIAFVGTSKDKENLYRPLIFRKNNIKFAIFGVTDFVNMTFKNWRDFVAVTDTVRLGSVIREIRDSVDVIILSYHGGVEYIDRPAKKVQEFADWAVHQGVDIFLGHHPHVTYGVIKKGKSIIIHSLGNFIFFQPQHYWTQRSYGVKFLITKKTSEISIEILNLIPVNVSMQTQRLTDSSEKQKLFKRTQQLSNIDLSAYWN
ncbi:MAG: CapA family protein [Bacteroidota bacterium]